MSDLKIPDSVPRDMETRIDVQRRLRKELSGVMDRFRVQNDVTFTDEIGVLAALQMDMYAIWLDVDGKDDDE